MIPADACAKPMAGVRARAGNPVRPHKANGHAPAAPSADAEAIMACMTAGFARLEKTLEKSLEKVARARK